MTRDFDSEMRQVLSTVAMSTTPLDASNTAPLTELGIDSVGMIDLVYEIERQFAVTIADGDVTSENFASIASLVNLVRAKCAA